MALVRREDFRGRVAYAKQVSDSDLPLRLRWLCTFLLKSLREQIYMLSMPDINAVHERVSVLQNRDNERPIRDHEVIPRLGVPLALKDR